MKFKAHLKALLTLVVFAGWCAGLCVFNGTYWWGWFVLYPMGAFLYLYVYTHNVVESSQRR